MSGTVVSWEPCSYKPLERMEGLFSLRISWIYSADCFGSIKTFCVGGGHLSCMRLFHTWWLYVYIACLSGWVRGWYGDGRRRVVHPVQMMTSLICPKWRGHRGDHQGRLQEEARRPLSKFRVSLSRRGASWADRQILARGQVVNSEDVIRAVAERWSGVYRVMSHFGVTWGIFRKDCVIKMNLK